MDGGNGETCSGKTRSKARAKWEGEEKSASFLLDSMRLSTSAGADAGAGAGAAAIALRPRHKNGATPANPESVLPSLSRQPHSLTASASASA